MTCRKKPYWSRSKAKKAMKLINRNIKYDLKSIYFCQHCQVYHLSSSVIKNPTYKKSPAEKEWGKYLAST